MKRDQGTMAKQNGGAYENSTQISGCNGGSCGSLPSDPANPVCNA